MRTALCVCSTMSIKRSDIIVITFNSTVGDNARSERRWRFYGMARIPILSQVVGVTALRRSYLFALCKYAHILIEVVFVENIARYVRAPGQLRSGLSQRVPCSCCV